MRRLNEIEVSCDYTDTIEHAGRCFRLAAYKDGSMAIIELRLGLKTALELVELPTTTRGHHLVGCSLGGSILALGYREEGDTRMTFTEGFLIDTGYGTLSSSSVRVRKLRLAQEVSANGFPILGRMGPQRALLVCDLSSRTLMCEVSGDAVVFQLWSTLPASACNSVATAWNNTTIVVVPSGPHLIVLRLHPDRQDLEMVMAIPNPRNGAYLRSSAIVLRNKFLLLYGGLVVSDSNSPIAKSDILIVADLDERTSCQVRKEGNWAAPGAYTVLCAPQGTLFVFGDESKYIHAISMQALARLTPDSTIRANLYGAFGRAEETMELPSLENTGAVSTERAVARTAAVCNVASCCCSVCCVALAGAFDCLCKAFLAVLCCLCASSDD